MRPKGGVEVFLFAQAHSKKRLDSCYPGEEDCANSTRRRTSFINHHPSSHIDCALKIATASVTMPFNKEDAYFIASLLTGQIPIGRGAVWLVPCICVFWGYGLADTHTQSEWVVGAVTANNASTILYKVGTGRSSKTNPYHIWCYSDSAEDGRRWCLKEAQGRHTMEEHRSLHTGKDKSRSVRQKWWCNKHIWLTL